MKDVSIKLEHADDEFAASFAGRVSAIRGLREDIACKVLGHTVEEETWLIFDDMLHAEYGRLSKLLKVLDERAG